MKVRGASSPRPGTAMPLNRLRTLPLDRLFAKLRQLKPAGQRETASATDTAPPHEPESLPLGVEPLRVLVSPLAGDSAGTAAQHIHDRLAGRRGVTVRLA